jgi:hypothetical protein
VLEAARQAVTDLMVADAKKAVEQGLGQPLAVYLKSGKVRRLRDSSWNRLYDHTLGPEEGPEA